MEFPSYNHHHHHPNRYVPPPPPPTNFSDDRPNLYPHHQHLPPSLHLPPPPPLAYPSLPPPPPLPLPVPPPPPSYNPHQSNFTFLDAQNPSFFNNGRFSPPQPRFSNQSERFVYRTDSWSDSHRVPPELSHRNPILPDDHHRRMYSPDSRSENHYKPHVSERVIPSSRYRDETAINGYASSNIVSQEQQVFRGSSNNDGRNIDRYASSQATGSNSRKLEEFVEKYEPRYITSSENERVWDHHGEDSRRIHQVKGKKNDYEYESGRMSRVREGREEFKQVQKKSVLLRIGKPNNTNSRNRSHDQHFSKAESNNSNFRGKDKDREDSSLYVDHRMEEDSPVELDVSFKSNALVAKAVVTPSSSPVTDDNNTTQHRHRNKKTKRATEFDSPLKSSSNGLDCPSSSEKATKQQKVIKDPDGAPVVGPLSFKLKKKRKLINFKNTPSVSIFQLAEKDNKTDKGENKNGPSAGAMVSVKDTSEVDKINDGLSQLSEVSLNLKNDTQQISLGISASSGIEIQTESFASFDACSAQIITISPEKLNDRIQETNTSSIITQVSENDKTVGVVDETLDDPPNAIAEDDAVASCGKSFSEIPGENATPSKVVASDEDEFVDIVELNSETQRPDNSSDLLLKEPSLSLHDKSGEEAIVSSFIKDETISNYKDGSICEKEVVTGLLNNSKTSLLKPTNLGTSASQVLTTKMPIKKPVSASTVTVPTARLVFTNSRMKNPSKSIVKARTWHRSVNNNNTSSSNISVPRPPAAAKQIGTFQNAYIRSGNSLVRKGSPSVSRSSVYQLNPGAVVRPKTPPLSGGTKLPDSTTTTTLEDENMEGKMIEYVKPKSNQLVAANSSSENTQASASDGYYKRRKNQLIRTLESASIKRQSSKKYRNSSVWTLGGQSLPWRKEGVLKLMFPWKRTKYNTSSSLISRSTRKREMIYTRSKHGFSLRMSKLLSVGGSSLKWSKSMEKKSKKANEEATLAVAAAEKKRREGGRIFRIGLVRYKMDPSRRTLQRISDEEASTSKKSKDEMRIPKRLLIGHDEYLRIGNGNQLVRNPKRRTRVFANEKVRWSLHTARSRLARNKKYCQFFTRFGKCNKDDGKCHYIHDSSKIAVCTKFLKGLCSNPDCNLTHKVIPERMQDCSYFLQGLCSNQHCPYRHVNVNSAASVCEDFLKGYCADGNECRKKHTYACPVFEATGECSQGTKCKLHHPKNRNTRLKRKPQQEHQKNSRGRYFGAVSATMPVSETHHFKNDDDLSQQGNLNFAEYISLDFGDQQELEDAMITDQTTVVTSQSLEDLGDPDDLTKPIGIMRKMT